ncbi:MAG: transcriptional repressor TraM [Xanthobacteraceae bacterium]
MTTGDNEKYDNVDVAATLSALIASLSRTQLEKLAIEAIHEHRGLLAKAEAAFESLENAEDAKADTAGELRETYTKAMLAVRAQQSVLATLVERLGFIPRVPPS